MGRIFDFFDNSHDSHNVKRLLKLIERNPAIFSKAALRKRKEKDLASDFWTTLGMRLGALFRQATR